MGFRGAGVLGATVIIAGGVAYLAWKRTEKKPKSLPETGNGARSTGEEAGERREEIQAQRHFVTAAPPVIEVTPAPKTSQVQNFDTPSLKFCCRKLN